MPTTRRGQTSSSNSERSKSKSTLSAQARGTDRSKVTNHPDDQIYSPADRATKRRRTETLNNKTSSANIAHGELLSRAGGTDGPPALQDVDASHGDYLAHSAARSQHDGPPFEDAAASAGNFGQLEPDMTKAISDIIDHSERFEQYCAISTAGDTEPSGSKSLIFAKTGSRMKVESLSILDNLSSQILSTIAKSSYQDTIALMREPESEAGQEYSTVQSLFDHTKRVYSSKSPFLSPSELDLLEPAQVETLRKANLATFVSSIFGSQEVGFAELNDTFLEIFVPENGRLLKAQGSLFLDLKTQAFISSMHTPERSKTELLYTLFPDDIDSRILQRRPGARGLAPSEQDFVKRTFSRREILLADVNNPAALDALPDKYHWDDFLRDISSYISKNFEMLNTQPKVKLTKGRNANGEAKELAQEQLQSNFSVMPLAAPERASDPPRQEDFVAKAARAAQIALQGHNISIPAPGSAQMQPYSPPRQAYQQPIQIHTNFQQYIPPSQSQDPNSSRSNQPPNYGPLPNLPHVSQTAPTQVLYERARQAATTKSSPTSRRAGLPSQRRPWTTEEENALMAGLDRVRGPHWSQILAMFGPGGTINESLKDRNQVQLKDKARNLKLFFLKSGIEVPYYLKYVTGDLKTRAPGQASKNEARERHRQQGEEDKAHFNGVQGIMALAEANSSMQEQQQQHDQTTDGHAAIEGIGGVDELQGFQAADGPLQNGLHALDDNADANLDPNLETMPDLPPAMKMQAELPATQAPGTKTEA